MRGEQRRGGSDAALLRMLGVQAAGWVLVAAGMFLRHWAGPGGWGLGWKALLVVGVGVVLAAFVGGFRIRFRQIRARNRR